MKTEARLPRESIWPRVFWGVFLLLAIALLAVTADTRVAITFILTAAALVVIAWRYPYVVLAAWMPLSFLLGVQVLVSTGYYRVGERTFGTSLEVSIGETIALALIAAWALRILLLWRGRRDRHWKPWLPLAVPFGAMLIAHFITMFGPGQPAPTEVLRFVARYQLFLYLSCIALVVNFVRSKKRLRQVLIAMSVLGVVFAFDGLRNMVVLGAGGVTIRQAQPAAILEVNPLGGNQHSLAETLIVAMGCAIAYAALVSPTSKRRMLALWAAGLMFVVCVLTFSRTAWIVLALEALVLGATVFREDVKRYRRQLAYALYAGIPLAIVMIVYSLSRGALGSLDARGMLTEIAWAFFQGSPWIGVGAGTFAPRVAGTYAFLADFGIPLDSHGILQKVAAEAGVVGLAALTWTIVEAGRLFWKAWEKLPTSRSEHVAYAVLLVTAGASFAYQLTSTSYWTPRLWVPIGLALAAGRIFGTQQAARDPDFLRTSHHG